jgi:hypothetical protein
MSTTNIEGSFLPQIINGTSSRSPLKGELMRSQKDLQRVVRNFSRKQLEDILKKVDGTPSGFLSEHL